MNNVIKFPKSYKRKEPSLEQKGGLSRLEKICRVAIVILFGMTCFLGGAIVERSKILKPLIQQQLKQR